MHDIRSLDVRGTTRCEVGLVRDDYFVAPDATTKWCTKKKNLNDGLVGATRQDTNQNKVNRNQQLNLVRKMLGTTNFLDEWGSSLNSLCKDSWDPQVTSVYRISCDEKLL